MQRWTGILDTRYVYTNHVYEELAFMWVAVFVWTIEEAKKFEDGLQEAKDFFNIQRKHVSVSAACPARAHFLFTILASLEVS